MKELIEKEIQWLEVFAKKHEFFASFLLHFKLKEHFSNNQYYWLNLHINEAEEQGDTLLNPLEIKFLEENSKGNENLQALFRIYENEGYLEHGKYKEFLGLKAEMMGALTEVKAPE
ncbi:hypothetical protein LCGC14_1738730, partial [marine sediment metagenome]